MRLPVLLAALALPATLLAAPAPALARAEDRAPPELSGAIAEMADPARQQQVAAMAAAMAGMLLEMPVGPMLQSMARMAGEDPEAIDPATRVADLAGPQAGEMPDEIAARVPEMMGSKAAMAGALEAMLPQLREMARNLPAASE